MKRFKPHFMFLLYGAALAGFCVIQYLRYTDAFFVPTPHEHHFILPEADGTLRVELNSATAAQLAKIPGISRPIADRIVAYRKEIGGFSSLEQLRGVPDFPDSLLLQIGEYLYLTIPETSETQPTTEMPTHPEPTTECITESPTELLLNLNTASMEELCLLPEIGEKTAAAIVDYRTRIGGFTNRQQLLHISGIGSATLAAISGHLYIENEQPIVQETTDPPEIPIVCLNTATAEDLLALPNCTEELADNIIILREQIHGFSNILEVLYAEGMTDELFISWKPYLTVENIP